VLSAKLGAFGAHVGVMEAEERHAENAEHLEGHVGLEPRASSIVSPNQGRSKVWPAEGVAPRPGEAVPVGDGEAQVILQPLAHHHLVGIVVAEGEFVAAVGAFEGEGGDVFEEVGHVSSRMADCAAR
jgi:hypothetical protein